MLVNEQQTNTKEGRGRPQLKTITNTGLMIVPRRVRATPSPSLVIHKHKPQINNGKRKTRFLHTIQSRLPASPVFPASHSR